MEYGNYLPSPEFANLNGSIPAAYDMINLYNGSIKPSTVHTKDNATFYTYFRYLMEKAISVFTWEMPKEWSQDFFLYTLYSWGYIAVFNSWQYGLVAQWPALEGYSMQFQPTHVTFNNDWFTNVRKKIGTDAVLFKIMPDFRGLTDIISNYAAEMALASTSLEVNLLNSRVAFMFGVKDSKMAEDMKALYTKVSSGEPAVFYKKKKNPMDNDEDFWQAFDSNIKNHYIVTDLLSDMRKIENSFDTWFGIPNTNVEKRERMNTDEVNSNNAGTETFSGKLLKRLQNSCKDVNTLFNGEYMSVDWNPSIKRQMEVSTDGNTNINRNDNNRT